MQLIHLKLKAKSKGVVEEDSGILVAEVAKEEFGRYLIAAPKFLHWSEIYTEKLIEVEDGKPGYITKRGHAVDWQMGKRVVATKVALEKILSDSKLKTGDYIGFGKFQVELTEGGLNIVDDGMPIAKISGPKGRNGFIYAEPLGLLLNKVPRYIEWSRGFLNSDKSFNTKALKDIIGSSKPPTKRLAG